MANLKVRVTYEVDDFGRRAVAHHFGEDGMATRQQIKNMIENLIDAHFDDLVYDYQKDQDVEP